MRDKLYSVKIVNAATLANPHVVGLMIDIFDSKSSNTMIAKDYTIKLPKNFKCTAATHSFPENYLLTLS